MAAAVYLVALARAVEGRPYPGQRYRHGWIPVAFGWESVRDRSVAIDRDGPPSGRWVPGQWREHTRAAERAAKEAEVREYVAKPELDSWRAERSAEEIEDLIGQQVDMLLGSDQGVTTYQNGPHAIRVERDAGDVPVEKVAALLDDLLTAAPPRNGHRSFYFRAKGDGDNVTVKLSGDKAVRMASTVPGGNAIVFTSHVFDEASHDHHSVEMPMRRKVPAYVWAIAHEYGHTLYPHEPDNTTPIFEAALHAGGLDSTGSQMSDYGTFGGMHEIWAEAFAEWYLSGGTSENIYARTFAERFGW